jgi:integrase/recombinase XerD
VALFGDLCRTALVNYLQHPYNEKLEADSPLWLSENGEALGYAGFGMMIKRLEKASGVDFHAHSLRHTFATMMAQQGTNVFDLKEMLGHASITTTQIYVQQNMERLSEVHRLKSPLSVLSNQEKVDIKRRGRPRKYR